MIIGKSVSHGAISLEGSKVFGIEDPSDPTTIGWYTMNYSFAADKGKGRQVWVNEAKRLMKEKGIDLNLSGYYNGSSERNRGCRLGGRFDTESMDCTFND